MEERYYDSQDLRYVNVIFISREDPVGGMRRYQGVCITFIQFPKNFHLRTSILLSNALGGSACI